MPKTWVVHKIMSECAGSFADDFGRQLGYDIVDAYVHQAMRRSEYGYLVTRDGDPAFVPTDQLTAEETEAKVADLRRMGDGCHKHADELEGYARGRAIGC
jgi:hypothetical protein